MDIVKLMLKLQGKEIPKQLLGIPDAPKTIFNVGVNINELMACPRLAVVGARSMSPYGRNVTESLTDKLSADGVVIVSGLALGIDGIAHRTCLKNSGVTVAVLPSGIEYIYPKSHLGLARQIVETGGAIISERDGKISPKPYDFLTRNRLIAGLAEAVLLTEAAIRSGSLNTARHALDQGKTVFAVPGNITSIFSEGTNNLIKMGAILVSRAEDIYAHMGWEIKVARKAPKSLTDNETIIYKLLASGPMGGEDLLTKSKLSHSSFSEALTILEMEDLITPLGANVWSLK